MRGLYVFQNRSRIAEGRRLLAIEKIDNRIKMIRDDLAWAKDELV